PCSWTPAETRRALDGPDRAGSDVQGTSARSSGGCSDDRTRADEPAGELPMAFLDQLDVLPGPLADDPARLGQRGHVGGVDAVPEQLEPGVVAAESAELREIRRQQHDLVHRAKRIGRADLRVVPAVVAVLLAQGAGCVDAHPAAGDLRGDAGRGPLDVEALAAAVAAPRAAEPREVDLRAAFVVNRRRTG